mgnify:CR=1 FL=1
MVSCQTVPKFDFQSQFSMSKINPNLSLFFIEECQFRSTFFWQKITLLLWKTVVKKKTTLRRCTSLTVVKPWEGQLPARLPIAAARRHFDSRRGIRLPNFPP